MAYGVCEHCHDPVRRRDEVAMREGFSYHKKCCKCYVCSETNLHKAEVFKGVIFCSSCAQRIFQGCASVRKTKQQASSRAKHSRSKSRRRRERRKTQERRIDRDITGVIELAQLAGSTSGSCDTDATQKCAFNQRKEATTTMTVQVEQQGYDFQPKKSLKSVSLDMGTTTIVTQKLLQQINDPEVCSFLKPALPKEPANIPVADIQRNVTPMRHRKKKKDIVPPRPNKQIVSDLRIAELGVSTEIANMALRKKSELPVIIKSDSGTKVISSDSLSVLNQESAESREQKEWVDSYTSLQNKSLLDRRIGSIVKMPYKFFKKNILTRSSLVSFAKGNDNTNKSLYKRFKTLFNEEIAEHQGRGIRRLYSTINRRKTPYKLGWLNLVAKVSKGLAEQAADQDVPSEHSQVPQRPKPGSYRYSPAKQCKHFKRSHSYRCMRAQAMRLAGPTPSQLAAFRRRVKKYVAPKCVRRIAKGLYKPQEPPKVVEEPKPVDVQTVFKSRYLPKPDNAWGNIGKAYVHLWTAVL